MSRKRQLDSGTFQPPNLSDVRKRRRQYSEADAQLAKLFDSLADEAREVRISAAKELVLKFSPESEPDADLANRILTRLIRGLCSSRKGARFGFFVALTEVFRQLYGPSSISIADFEPNLHGLVKQIVELTQPDGKASGQEKKDNLLGRIFGFKSLIQSSVLVQPSTPKECQANVLEQIYTAAREKPWIREECGLILCDAVKTVARESQESLFVQQILDGLVSGGLAKTPEGIAIWLTVRAVLPDMELPDGIWHKKDPLCSKERQTLANVMKENYASVSSEPKEPGKKVKGGSSQTTLNFAWDVVMATVVQKEDAVLLLKFWTDIVDNNLFAASASPEQKSKGFQLFSRMLMTMPKWGLSPLFSPNLLRCLINQRNDSERYNHIAAKAPLDEMCARVKKEPDVAAELVRGLITKHGSVNFDRISKTKTVEVILTHADGEALEELVTLLEQLFYRPTEQDQRAADSQRQAIADMLVNIVRSRNKENASSIQGDASRWLDKLLLLLAKVAYFDHTGGDTQEQSPVPSVSQASRSMLQARIASCLAHLLSAKLDQEMHYPFALVEAIYDWSKNSATLTSRLDAGKPVLKAVKRSHKQLQEVAGRAEKAKSNKRPVLLAFKLLFSLTILQVYNGDPDAVAILDDLEACYLPTVQKDKSEDNANDQLIEIILSFAAKPSVLFRKLSEQVFSTFAADITAEGLQSLLDILEKKESLSGQQDLFDQDGSDVEQEASDEDDSDVEMIDGDMDLDDGATEGSEEEDASGDDDGEDASADDDGQADEDELARFDEMLADTLKTSKANGDAKDESSDDEDMDDEEMMALEPHLTKIFQERKKNAGKKRENKDAKETMINFKNRVLDLLLIYVKHQHANTMAMDLILPLLRLIRRTTSKQLAEKSFNLLKQYVDTSKKSLPKPEADAAVLEVLKCVHDEAKADSSKLHASASSRSSLFLAKVVTTHDPERFDQVIDLYGETQKQWHGDPKCKTHPSFFTEWTNWLIGTKKQ
ncbi:hypothetical protein K490DRAFT_39843 [Saccharata proteae CBS 121410]|uniref:DNA polymerase V n=1 Tax=Saccharata proteae CBS 121410 TaxID=1314787 RepID=A0A9P4I053_9PEZI|nr:hypothetical protein K490DRAFT_39843 [Saccharata proteae CBS 121410]